jgi:hypothetical protein
MQFQQRQTQQQPMQQQAIQQQPMQQQPMQQPPTQQQNPQFVAPAQQEEDNTPPVDWLTPKVYKGSSNF